MLESPMLRCNGRVPRPTPTSTCAAVCILALLYRFVSEVVVVVREFVAFVFSAPFWSKVVIRLFGWDCSIACLSWVPFSSCELGLVPLVALLRPFTQASVTGLTFEHTSPLSEQRVALSEHKAALSEHGPGLCEFGSVVRELGLVLRGHVSVIREHDSVLHDSSSGIQLASLIRCLGSVLRHSPSCDSHLLTPPRPP